MFRENPRDRLQRGNRGVQEDHPGSSAAKDSHDEQKDTTETARRLRDEVQ